MKPATRFGFDASFQRKLTRVLYQDHDYSRSVQDSLDPDLWDSRFDRFVVTVIRDQTRKGGQATKTVLVNEIRKRQQAGRMPKADIALLLEVVNKLKDPVTDHTYVREETSAFFKRQRLAIGMGDAMEALQSGDATRASALLRSAADYDPAPGGSLGIRLMEDLPARLKQRAQPIKKGIPTGTPLDSYMKHEGLVHGQLGVVLGPTGRGKSAYLIYMTKNAVELVPDLKAVHYTLELSDEDVAERYDANISQVPLNELENRGAEVEAAYNLAASHLRGNIIVKQYPPGTANVATIRAHLRRLENEGFRPGLVTIDYGDLLKSVTRYTDRFDELGAVFTEMRALAVELRVPVWTATQGNRASLEKENVSLSDISESIKKAEISDVIVALCQTPTEHKAKKMRIFIAKNRNGYTGGEFPMRADTATASFRAI